MKKDDSKTKPKIKRGSGNVFADLDYPDAEAHLLKANLVTRIRDVISESNLTQADAAKRIGLSQPDVSRLLRGHFREISVERLMRMLTRLGYNIDIVIRNSNKSATAKDIIHIHSQPIF